MHQLYCTCGGLVGNPVFLENLPVILHTVVAGGNWCKGTKFQVLEQKAQASFSSPLNKTISVVKYLWRILVC